MTVPNEQDDSQKPGTRQRSRNFPQQSLPKCVEWLEEIRNELGFKPFSKILLAQTFKLSASSGSFFTKVSAMNHFALLEGSSDQLRISELGKRIVAKQSEEDRMAAIQQAFQSADLFADLLKDFGGHKLPAQLANRLLFQYDITDSSKDLAAQCFIESARYAGLLDNDNYLSVPVSRTDDSGARQDSGRSGAGSGSRKGDTPPAGSDMPAANQDQQRVTLALGEGRVAHLILPNDITDEDIELLEAQIAVFKIQARIGAIARKSKPPFIPSTPTEPSNDE